METNLIACLLFLGFAMGAGLLFLLLRSRRFREARVLKNYFLVGLSGMLAKVVLADGRVDDGEVALADRAFAALNLSAAERELCLATFLAARTDGLDVRDHANRFMAAASPIAAECLYVFLWRLARADGNVDPAEEKVLERLALCLNLDSQAFARGKAGEVPPFERGTLLAVGIPPAVADLVA